MFQDERRWPHRLAFALGCALCLYIWAGGLLALSGGRQTAIGPVMSIDDRLWGLFHDGLAFALLGLLTAWWARTSRWWRAAASSPGLARIRVVATSMAAAACAHLGFGITLRHIPLAATPGFFRAVAFCHLGMATLVTAHVVLWAVLVRRRPEAGAALRRPSLVLLLLTGWQLFLGGTTWVVTFYWPTWLRGVEVTTRWTSIEACGWWPSLAVSTHAATGALLAATALWIAFRARHSGP
jgi:hypothetical protein